MENNGLVSTFTSERSARQSIKVLFEFSVFNPKHVFYRGVHRSVSFYRL
jgi:hypothetical protein